MVYDGIVLTTDLLSIRWPARDKVLAFQDCKQFILSKINVELKTQIISNLSSAIMVDILRETNSDFFLGSPFI